MKRPTLLFLAPLFSSVWRDSRLSSTRQEKRSLNESFTLFCARSAVDFASELNLQGREVERDQTEIPSLHTAWWFLCAVRPENALGLFGINLPED